MNKVVIYTYKPMNAYEFGFRAQHLLVEPDDSHQWFETAEYALPDGYSVGSTNSGALHIYDTKGQPVDIFDAPNLPGTPAVLIGDGPHYMHLVKVCDL